MEQTSDFHCVTTWSVRNLTWTGVRLVDVVRSLPNLGSLDELPVFATASAADRTRAAFVTEDLTQPDVLLATHLDGQPLDRRHGAPLRLVCPRQYGYKNVKHLTSLDFLHERPPSTLGPKEHLRARVAQEERHATLASRLVRLPYRLTIVPTALAAERGLRNSPR